MWCQPRTGRPASWNISTVGTRLFPTGRMYRAESVAPSSETKVTVWYSRSALRRGRNDGRIVKERQQHVVKRLNFFMAEAGENSRRFLQVRLL